MFYLIKLNPKPNIFTYNTIKNKFNYLKCNNFKKKMYTKVMVEPKLGISKIRKTTYGLIISSLELAQVLMS